MALPQVSEFIVVSGNTLPNESKTDVTDKQTLLAVLQFLKKHNLKGTEDFLKKETGLQDTDVSQDTSAQTASEVAHALAAYKSDDDPSIYGDHYRDLKAFIETCLDVHKVEIATILYPVFVHMYLELVYNNHEHHAREFYMRFHGDQEWYYSEDLSKLATVTKQEHMAGSQIMENFKSSKFVLKMSRDSYTHLKRYLQEKQLKTLLNIIQEHLFIDVFDGVPRTKLQIDLASGGVLGEAAREANKSKVLYGLLKEPDINIPMEEEEEGGGEGEDKPKGLPYGLQSRFLPLYFRTHGMSLSHISFFKLLLIPWMLKALWAPFVDRYGTKKLWLAYSMFGLFLTCILGSFTDPKCMFLLGFVLFLFNFLTATQDIAVDGLAIQVLAASELASGNIAQVVGYKFGAIFSGGFITWLGELYGLQWGTIFVGLAIFYLMAYLLIVKIVPTQNQEDHKPPKEDSYKKSDDENDLPQEKSAGSVSKGRHWIIKHFQFVLHTQETKWTLLYVLVYKLGEQGALTLVPLFLVDQAVPASSVGFWTGLVGQTVSILGSLLGGWLVACFRITPYRGILLFSLLRIVLLSMVFITVLTWPSVDAASDNSISYGVLVGLMCTMLLGSGVITTTTFTLMMFCSQRSPSAIQASHYTTMATVEVLGKLTFSVLIGSLADMFGYSLTFLLFVMLAFVVLPVILKCPQSLIDMFER